MLGEDLMLSKLETWVMSPPVSSDFPLSRFEEGSGDARDPFWLTGIGLCAPVPKPFTGLRCPGRNPVLLT